MSPVLSGLQRAAAANIVSNCLKVRPRESVVVETWPHTLPMASAIVDEVRRAGALPVMLLEDEDAFWKAVGRKQARLLGTMSASERAALKAADVFVMLWGPGDSQRFESLDLTTMDQVTAWNDPWYDLAEKAGLRGLRLGAGFATPSNARQWGLSLDRVLREILEATCVDPRKMAKDGARLQRRLHGGCRLRLRHPNGTDLEIGLSRVPSKVQTGIPGGRTKVDRYCSLNE